MIIKKKKSLTAGLRFLLYPSHMISETESIKHKQKCRKKQVKYKNRLFCCYLYDEKHLRKTPGVKRMLRGILD